MGWKYIAYGDEAYQCQFKRESFCRRHLLAAFYQYSFLFIKLFTSIYSSYQGNVSTNALSHTNVRYMPLADKGSLQISCEGEVVKGEAGSWIVNEAERLNAELVVVGSHAYGVLKR
jgi:hypothetical protein